MFSSISRRTVFLLALLAMCCGCRPQLASSGSNATATAASGSASTHVTLFAAASLSDVLAGIKKDLAERKVAEIDMNLSASGTLAQQIEHGAGADLFFSASVEWVDALVKKDLVARRSDVLGNSLVLVVPVDSKATIHELKDLGNADVRRIAIADPKSAPAGKHARKALEALQLWEQVWPKKVAVADDVRHALLFVERGEVDAALVYATDAIGNSKIRIIAKVDEKLAGPIRYSLVLLKKGEENPAAVATFTHLLSPAAAAVFRSKGFQITAEPHQQEL